MEFQQLLPTPRVVEVSQLLESLDLRATAPDDRPYTLVNFIASIDGRASVNGRSGALGDEGDRAMFHSLREQADAVLAGTTTLRTEGYGRMLGKAERRERRTARGLTPEPLACIVTRSGELPLEIPLFSEPEARVVVFAPHTVELGESAAQIDVVTLDPGEMTLTTALRRLRQDYGIRLLLCEGGPRLFASLLGEELVHELFLTLAPKLAGGGTAPSITMGEELAQPADGTLEWLLERNGALYLRYGLA